MEELAKIGGLSGIPFMFPNDFPDPVKLKEKVRAFNLSVGNICPDTYTTSHWKNGTLSHIDLKTRKESIKLREDEITEHSKNLMVGGGFPGPCLVDGKGVRAVNSKGKSYIDCTSQSWALYLGYANQEINDTVHEHMRKLSHVHQGFHTKVRYSLANKLASIAPKNLNRVSFTVGGGLAVEAGTL